MYRNAHESKLAHFDWDDAHMNHLQKGSQYACLNLTSAKFTLHTKMHLSVEHVANELELRLFIDLRRHLCIDSWMHRWMRTRIERFVVHMHTQTQIHACTPNACIHTKLHHACTLSVALSHTHNNRHTPTQAQRHTPVHVERRGFMKLKLLHHIASLGVPHDGCLVHGS